MNSPEREALISVSERPNLAKLCLSLQAQTGHSNTAITARGQSSRSITRAMARARASQPNCQIFDLEDPLQMRCACRLCYQY